jgi:hypothetical protein
LALADPIRTTGPTGVHEPHIHIVVGQLLAEQVGIHGSMERHEGRSEARRECRLRLDHVPFGASHFGGVAGSVSTKQAPGWSALVAGTGRTDPACDGSDGDARWVVWPSDDAQGSVVARLDSGPGTASILRISGSAKSRNDPSRLPDMGGHIRNTQPLGLPDMGGASWSSTAASIGHQRRHDPKEGHVCWS